jgi:hypothetical protein
MKRMTVVLGVVALIAALARPVLAQGWGPGFGPRMTAQTGAATVTADQATSRARQYLGQYANPDLALAELIEFPTVFYLVVQERSSGKAAFALLVNRVTGNVHHEMGPPMMWNTKYGRMAGGPDHPMRMSGPGGGPGPMHERGAMMGPGAGPRPQVPVAQPAPGAPARVAPMDEVRARTTVQAWVSQAFPGASIGKVIEFPGFFTYRLVRDGRPLALVSLSAFGGPVWYAWHYGAIVSEQQVR